MAKAAKPDRKHWGGETDGDRFTEAWWTPDETTAGVEKATGPVVPIVDEEAGGIVGYLIAELSDELFDLLNKGFAQVEKGA